MKQLLFSGNTYFCMTVIQNNHICRITGLALFFENILLIGLKCLILNSHSDLETASFCNVLDTLKWLVLFTIHIKAIHFQS